MRVVLLGLLFLACLVSAAPQPTLVGTWTDQRYGGNLYFCVDSQYNVWSTYSEAGVMWGRANEDMTEAAGRWYEVGGDKECNAGRWQAILFPAEDEDDIDYMEIVWFCRERLDKPVSARYESRLSTVANGDQCNEVATVMPFQGSWANLQLGLNKAVFCSDGFDAYGSITTDTNTEVYVEGNSFEEGRIFTGNYTLVTANRERATGDFMFFATSRREGVQFIWTPSVNTREIDNPRRHTVDQMIFRGEVDNGCRDNAYVIGENPASTLHVAWALIVAVVAVVLF